MTTVQIQIVSACSGGEHATVRITKGAARDVQMLVTDLRSSLTQDDLEAFARVSLRLLAEGKTLAQFKTAAQAGFTVTI